MEEDDAYRAARDAALEVAKRWMREIPDIPFCQRKNAVTAQNVGIATNQNGWYPVPEDWQHNQQNTILQQQAFGAANQQNTTLLSGMPVPSPVSHAKQEADALLAALQAKLDAAEAEIARLKQPAIEPAEPSPFVNALSVWPGRGGVDQWSGMPAFVGRGVK